MIGGQNRGEHLFTAIAVLEFPARNCCKPKVDAVPNSCTRNYSAFFLRTMRNARNRISIAAVVAMTPLE